MNSDYIGLLRCDVLTFANQAHVELYGARLGEDWYLRLLAYDVERIVSGETNRYLANLPPGHGKTFFFSVVLAALVLGRNPSARILIVSYGEELATEICRKIRAILQASWYRETFPKTILAKDQKAARNFATTAGGRVFATSLDGAITGVRCDYLLVDDPVQIRDSGNCSYLASVNARFDTDLVSRLNNPRTGTIVVVHHRLNQADLTAYLQNRRSWVHRTLPLVASEDRDFQLRNGVWRRNKGDILRPDAYTPDYIAELRENTGPPGFAPLYQQCFDGSDMI